PSHTGTVASNEVADDPTTSTTDSYSDYRFDTVQWSSMKATGRNLTIVPWDFDTGRQGFTVGLNSTSSRSLPNTVANWGEDKNFNGVLDWYCASSPATVCPGVFPNAACGRCSNDASVICVGSNNAPCGGGATSCSADPALGTCVSDEDRDPQNGVL